MDFEVYCDESGIEALCDKEAHKYVVIGGIWLPGDYREVMKKSLKDIQEKYGVAGELKWNKISPAYFKIYREVVDYFFSASQIEFRAIVIDAGKVDNEWFNDGNAELGFYKFYYQLIKHWLKNGNSYSVFVDYKVNGNKNRIKELHGFLDRANHLAQLRQTQALPSHESLGIQLADVLTGIVAAKFNGQNTSTAKLALISLAEDRLGHEIRCTRKMENKFNIFNINLQNG